MALPLQLAPPPLLENGRLDNAALPDLSALLLYNASVDGHRDFMQDVAAAHAQQRKQYAPATWEQIGFGMFQADCEVHKTLCSWLAHGFVNAEEEPPLIFFHEGQRSEAFHDVPLTHQPHEREKRVAAMLDWLSLASTRGARKVEERRQVLMPGGHADQHMALLRKVTLEVRAREEAEEWAAKGYITYLHEDFESYGMKAEL